MGNRKWREPDARPGRGRGQTSCVFSGVDGVNVASMDVFLGAVDSSYTIGAAVLLAWGLLDCFFGYLIFRIAVALLGALVLGMFATSALSQWFWDGEILYWVAFGGGALLGLLLSFAFYLVGVFLAGFSFGYAVVLGLVPFTGPEATVLLGAIAGAACGLLAMIMQRLIISAATAFGGAFRVALAAAFFVDGLDWQFFLRSPEQIPALLVGRWWIPVAMLGLGLCGLVVQLRSGPAGKKKED